MKVAARLAAVASGVALVTAMGAGVATASPTCSAGSVQVGPSSIPFFSVQLSASSGCQIDIHNIGITDDGPGSIPPQHVYVTQVGTGALVRFFAPLNPGPGGKTDEYTVSYTQMPINNGNCGQNNWQCCKPGPSNQKCCGPPGMNNKYPKCCPQYPGNNKYPQCCPQYPGNNKYPQCCPKYPGQKCQPPPPPHKKCVVKKYWHKGHLYKKVYCPGKHYKKHYKKYHP